jgi:hypothetical protein
MALNLSNIRFIHWTVMSILISHISSHMLLYHWYRSGFWDSIMMKTKIFTNLCRSHYPRGRTRTRWRNTRTWTCNIRGSLGYGYSLVKVPSLGYGCSAGKSPILGVWVFRWLKSHPWGMGIRWLKSHPWGMGVRWLKSHPWGMGVPLVKVPSSNG